MDRQTDGNLTNGCRDFLKKERGKEKGKRRIEREGEIKEEAWLWKEISKSF